MRPVWLALLWLVTWWPHSTAMAADEKAVRREIDLVVAQLWESEDFVRLEKLSNEYRESKLLTPSGLWHLTVFYGSLSEQVSSDLDDPRAWSFMEQRAKRWVVALPQSPSAHLQYAQALLKQAWHARGNGYQSTVTAEGSRRFQDKLEAARRYLESVEGKASSDPRWYELMINIANWQSWPEAKARPLIEAAIAREPRFWQLYFAAASYYVPHWHGDAQRLEEFARWAADRTGGREGDALYTRIYWWASNGYFRGEFIGTKIDCARMMRGVDRLVETHPDPWNINHFASFAVSCGDRQRAQALFLRIGDKPDLDAWERSSKNFARFRAWAFEK